MNVEVNKIDQVKSAFDFSQKGDTEGWVHKFLLGEGKNQPLSEGLNKQKRYWLGPVEVALSRLDRVVGPEEGMEYPENIDGWNQRVDRMKVDIVAGWIPAPLIAEYREGVLSLRDGNHRMKALQEAGYNKYWTLIWFNKEEQRGAFKP